MSENSGIEWTDHTFNPWWGCQKVSLGCKNCYAEKLCNRFDSGVTRWGPRGARGLTSEANWNQPLNWNRAAEKAGTRAKVFCASMADVFEDFDGPVVVHSGKDKDEPTGKTLSDVRSTLWDLIKETPYLDWLLLTKRPENIMRMVPESWRTRFPDNVWLGTSVENQEQAEIRIPHLEKCPAVVQFLSCEPLLEKIEPAVDRIDWVIAGGESGPNRRPYELDWFYSLRDQCKTAGIPFFMKQLDKVATVPEDLLIREWPKENNNE